MTASPEALHVLAHRAGARQRDGEDWWGSAIETALAGLSATRHPAAHREQAERALDRLERWQRSGEARPVSADAVALAVAARTAAALARSSAALSSAAVASAEHMAGRGTDVVPELHIALVVWALDDLISDREQAPWPAIREWLIRGNVYGMDAALRAYATCVAARQFDAGKLVQAMLAHTPQSPAPSEGSVVLWLLGAAIDRCGRVLSAEEPGLRALVDWRARITERLAVELDENAFREPIVGDFDPEVVHDHRGSEVYLSPMEALLLDVALAPADDEDGWLTYPQAEAMLGRQTALARALAGKERRRFAAALALAALLWGALLGLALVTTGVSTAVAVGWSVAATFGALTGCAALGRTAVRRRRLVDALGVAAATGALCAALNAVNQMLAKPLLSDAAGVIAGAAIVAVAAVLWAFLGDDDLGPRA